MEAVAVVGASLAGLHAARALRIEGFAGRIVVVDADRHDPYDRPPLSKQFLAGTWDRDRLTLAPVREELDLDWRLGRRATALDAGRRSVTLDDGEVLAVDGVVVATGTAARRLPGTDGIAGVHVVRTLDDAVALRADLDAGARRVVVVGAGFIGAEVAATCRGLGVDVTMVEALATPFERVLGPAVGSVLADVHRDHGVDLRAGVGVAGIDGAGRVEQVRLSDGAVVEADVVVVGIGVVPATDWLEGSGLTVDDGIVVDETLLAAPGVVAAGDIARWPSARYGEALRVEHWDMAIAMGEAAARRLLVPSHGSPAVFDHLPWFWSDQYDRKIQLAGRAGADHAVEVVVGSVEERRFVALYGRDGRVDGVLGMNRPRHVMQLRALADERVAWDEGLARARALG
ncbi:MAG: FAD-dependent oxidoreductase [Acidimicrobiales bacterium]|jgi:NADPH-dependent 2,4-dienoyl-CoA reductase/sulfur reductase-like enzyme|nr:FAD-dependent oxidoreductase [Acidimicrobiales bacterium]